MSHEIDRVLQAAAGGVWLIEPTKAAQIVSVLALRASGQSAEWDEEPREAQYAGDPVPGNRGPVHVLRLHGSIMPRGGMMARMSGGASMAEFQKAFRQAAEDTTAQAIVIDVDSPGGMVDLVPETAAMIHAARRADRPIIAVANTLAASAAYWIASAADEIVVTPSGLVGSIGVMTMRDKMAKALEQAGIERTMFYEGPRKAESHPFGPALDDEARAAIQKEVQYVYNQFTADVAKFRGVPVATVRADPESAEAHFGGGRAYHARDAVRLGMADRIATFDETLMRAAQGRRSRRASLARRRLSLA